jgi:hypothetical protein
MLNLSLQELEYLEELVAKEWCFLDGEVEHDGNEAVRIHRDFVSTIVDKLQTEINKS